MKHLTIDEIHANGGFASDFWPLSKRDRLARWARLLEENPGRQLSTLRETEHQQTADRNLMSDPNSPIAMAFADPYLRALGLRDDTYGEAKRFFELSDRHLHDVLCYCHYGPSVTAQRAAQGVRSAMAADFRAALWSKFSESIRALDRRWRVDTTPVR